MKNLKPFNFSDLYTMSSGISSKPEQAGHGSPFASFSTIFNNYFLPDELQDLMDSSDKEQATYSIKKGDIFLTRTSETLHELGMSSVALKNYPGATYSGFVKRLRPKQDGVVYEKYIGFYLRGSFFRKVMTNNAIMTLRASLNEEIFSYLKLHLPDFETQKTIGDFLFLLNTKIELNNRINAKLESIVKLIYGYWFVQFDFPSNKGKPYKTSGGKMFWSDDLKREIPEGWELKKLSDLATIRAGGDKPKILSLERTETCCIPIYSNGISKDGLYGYTNEATIKDESITVSARGTIGFSVLRSKPFVPIIRLIVITPHLVGSAKYFDCYLKTIAFDNSGSVQQQLTIPQVSQIKMLNPPFEILKKFEAITAPVTTRIEVLKEENQKLAELRDWLLPMLMSGQIKVLS